MSSHGVRTREKQSVATGGSLDGSLESWDSLKSSKGIARRGCWRICWGTAFGDSLGANLGSSLWKPRRSLGESLVVSLRVRPGGNLGCKTKG